MDNELKAKINMKVDEILKTRATRELNIEEMDRVSGGKSNTPNPPDDIILYGMNAKTAGEVLRGIYSAWGRDVAVAYAKENWQKTNDWDNYVEAGGPEYAVHMLWGKGYKSEITGKPVC